MNATGTEATDKARAGVTITREYDFPREAIFRMLTDAKRAAKVWGPEGAVKLLFELDPRPGGTLRIHDEMDGKVAKTSGTVLEIVAPELFVFRSVTTGPDGGAPWEALQTVRLEELGSKKTRVTIHVKILATGAFPGGVESLEVGYAGGWGETLDMLGRQLR